MYLSEQNQQIFEKAKNFGIEKVYPMMQELKDSSEAAKAMYQLAVENGFCGLNVERALGGKAFSYLQTALTYEGLAYGDGMFAFMIQLHNNITLLVNRLTQSELFKSKVSEMALGKKLTAFALTEATAGSDPAANSGYAVKKSDGYHLYAKKQWIANAALADYFVVFTKKEKEKGMYMFLADRNMKGITVHKMPEILGGNAVGHAEVIFDDCVIPEEMLITERGYQEALASIDVARTFVPAICVGVAQRCIDISIAYLKQRVSMGKAIIDSQAIQWQLAELEAKVEAARQLVYRTAEGMDAGEKIAFLAAKNKLFAASVCMEAATLCVQLHGANGMIKNDYPARNLVCAKLFSILDGSSEIQKFIIGRQLSKKET